MHYSNPRLTYANVMATIAVFVSLGGTSYAAIVVTGANVKNGSLTGADMRNGSITGLDVLNRSIIGADIRDGSLSGADIGNGTVTASDVSDGSLTGSDMRDDSISGADIATGTVTGVDVAEETLSAVPNAEKIDGKNAVQIAARARGSASVVANITPRDYPMAGGSWSQAADETDEFFGEITFSAPNCGMAGSGISVEFKLDGAPVASEYFGDTGDVTKTFQLSALVFEPGTKTQRTLTAEIFSTASCGEPAVKSLKVNVIGYK